MSIVRSESESSWEDDSLKSHIACHTCRKRKVRCGRELPHCSVCERTLQICEYPDKILKPGPKIGTRHRVCKRKRVDRDTEDEAVESPTTNLILEVPSTAAPDRYKTSTMEMDGGNTLESNPNAGVGRGQDLEFKTHESIRRDSINIHDLSFILHPTHEPSTSEPTRSPISAIDRLENERGVMLTKASYALSIAPDALEKMIKIYFDNMTAINIFHEPTFEDKVRNIGSTIQVHGLMAAVLAFSAKFYRPKDFGAESYNNGTAQPKRTHQPAFFLDLASKFADEALRACGEEPPPLCLVQTFVLIAHGQLTQGVRGKAWRSLGMCVRLAYELNLHLVDVAHPQGTADVQEMSEWEEKRRVWWAIWEMDVFASTVRRCPTAINWSQIETLLPIEDENWFADKYQQSCFLEQDPVRRWKVLKDSGNHSPKAWYIIINSLMKEAQSISSPRGIPNLSPPGATQTSAKSSEDQKQKHNTTMTEQAKEKLETLTNSVYCFVQALPPHLSYRNQYLGFDTRQPGQTFSLRQYHCGIYNIHVMTQLAKLMINHYDIFKRAPREPLSTLERRTGKTRGCPTANYANSTENFAIHQYFDAADEILHIIRRSSDDHIRWINNFLSSTIWLASAVQMVHKEFGPPGTNTLLIKSKFEALNMTYKKCVCFWDIQTAMQRNLETLEAQLEMFRMQLPKKSGTLQQKVRRRSQVQNDSRADELISPLIAVGQNKRRKTQNVKEQPIHSQSENLINFITTGRSSLHNHRWPTVTTSPEPGNNINTPTTCPQFRSDTFQNHEQSQTIQQHGPQYQSQPSQPYRSPLSPALSPDSALDFMHFSSQTEREMQQQAQHADGGFSALPENTNEQSRLLLSAARGGQGLGVNDDSLQRLAFEGMQMEGWNTELPNYIDELLTGAYMY